MRSKIRFVAELEEDEVEERRPVVVRVGEGHRPVGPRLRSSETGG